MVTGRAVLSEGLTEVAFSWLFCSVQCRSSLTNFCVARSGERPEREREREDNMRASVCAVIALGTAAVSAASPHTVRVIGVSITFCSTPPHAPLYCEIRAKICRSFFCFSCAFVTQRRNGLGCGLSLKPVLFDQVKSCWAREHDGSLVLFTCASSPLTRVCLSE